MGRFLIALLALALIAGPASAWGPQGHEVVASIADKALTPVARN